MTVDPGLTPEQQADLDRRHRMLDAVRIAAERVERGPQVSGITDEELAEIEEQWPFINADGPLVRRLIAALRASREQLALVRSERDTARAEAAREYYRAEDSRAEVERLEALLDDEGIDPNTC